MVASAGSCFEPRAGQPVGRALRGSWEGCKRERRGPACPLRRSIRLRSRDYTEIRTSHKTFLRLRTSAFVPSRGGLRVRNEQSRSAARKRRWRLRKLSPSAGRQRAPDHAEPRPRHHSGRGQFGHSKPAGRDENCSASSRLPAPYARVYFNGSTSRLSESCFLSSTGLSKASILSSEIQI